MQQLIGISNQGSYEQTLKDFSIQFTTTNPIIPILVEYSVQFVQSYPTTPIVTELSIQFSVY